MSLHDYLDSPDKRLLEAENKAFHLESQLAQMTRERDELKAALCALIYCEGEYRTVHDTKGDGSIEAGKAWDAMRRCSMRAVEALAKLDAGERYEIIPGLDYQKFKALDDAGDERAGEERKETT